MIRLLIFLLLAAMPLRVGAAEPGIHTLQTGGVVQNIIVGNNIVSIILTNGTAFTLQFSKGQYGLKPSSVARNNAHTRPGNILPDGNIVVGTGTIRRAWLSAPTTRYGHGVLGDQIEAGAIAAELANQKITTLTLDKNAVFEDRTPRLVDIDGDGEQELLVVKTYLDRGAALAVVTVRDQDLVIAAEAQPIGLSQRWLNPVGVADFDDDGVNEIAAVITPHIGGTLQLYEWHGHQLVEDHSKFGFSNHQMGSRNQDLSIIIDLNNDGTPDMLLPNAGRGALLGVTFRGGVYKELLRVPLSGAITSPIRSTDIDGDGYPEIIFAIAPGELNVISLHP